MTKENQTGVENKHFKREQSVPLASALFVVVTFMCRMIEALEDPKTWLFALFAVLSNIPNSLLNQIQIITSSFGFNVFQTTLLGCVGGVVEILAIFSGVKIASRIPNSRAWVGIAYSIPTLLGILLVNFLPWHDKVGLLCSLWTAGIPDILSTLRRRKFS